ncbi:hypothetical protein [Legionella tucsonensis]|uniref:Uncharacterized protein n=1 Tax=Legionella tucsonensis TaxID=40335 RepID=A0A0W0ZNK1_9GAMM|nr:hypothetical protein [Legionella tucsonensis]KTD70779.1 hypothetical protein Ltuc_2790 [Legionella tucsonensis]
MSNLFLLNTAGLEDKDVLNILVLSGITQEMDFDSEIAKAPAGVKQFLKLAKIYYERHETSTSITRFTVKPGFEKCVVGDVPAVKNEIRLVCDEGDGNKWYLVAEKKDRSRFEKEISKISEDEARESSLCGVKLTELKSNLNHQTVDTLNYLLWRKLKSECFSHPNPLREIGDLLRANLDSPKSDLENQKIKNIRRYLNKKAKEQDTSLIIYSNKAEEDSCGRKESQYVKEKVERELSQEQQLHILYIGGGHGWPKYKWNGMLSALKTHHVTELHNSLAKRGVMINSIIFGSCFSASYANDFSSLLHPRCGVMLSSTISQGGANFFENVVSFVLSEENSCDFFKTIPRDLQISKAPSPTGICISNKEKHFGLELSEEETGLPIHSAGDEYELSLSIVIRLRKAKPESIFGISLDECHDEQQKGKFNKLLSKTIDFQESDDIEDLPCVKGGRLTSEKVKTWSPLAKFSLFAGGILLIGGGCYFYSQCNKGGSFVK